VAALAGAQLVALGNAIAARFPRDMARAWGDAGLRMTEGQLRDLERAGSVRGTIEDFIRVCWKKTGAAFELAARFGGVAGGLRGRDLEAMVRFGRHVGIAFQLFDDLNDFVFHPGEHRPPANDLRERVYTLPVLYAYNDDTSARARIRELLRNDGCPLSQSAISEICKLIGDSGALAKAVERTVGEREYAGEWLDRLPATEARENLRRLLDRLQPPTELQLLGRGQA
jgi:geranylgeranyl pyrophosphate synthase